MAVTSLVNIIANEIKEEYLKLAPRLPTREEKRQIRREVAARHGKQILEWNVDHEGHEYIMIRDIEGSNDGYYPEAHRVLEDLDNQLTTVEYIESAQGQCLASDRTNARECLGRRSRRTRGRQRDDWHSKQYS